MAFEPSWSTSTHRCCPPGGRVCVCQGSMFPDGGWRIIPSVFKDVHMMHPVPGEEAHVHGKNGACCVCRRF